MTATLLLILLFSRHAPAITNPAARPAAVYEVRPGDTLWSITGRDVGHPQCWPALYALNRRAVGSNPDLILPGERLRLLSWPPVRPAWGKAGCLSCHGQGICRTSPGPERVPPPPRRRSGPEPHGILNCPGLERLWIYAGGTPGAAFIAAEIAMAESGGYQYAHSLTDDYGYWQINISHGALATFDAYGNARAAIIISGDGQNWSPWTTYLSGAYAGRC